MISALELGVALTVLAWLGLLVAVVHGTHVVEAIAAGTYRNGPFGNREQQEEREPEREPENEGNRP